MSSPGAVVFCPECKHEFGMMTYCPWDDCELIPIPGADPVAKSIYAAIEKREEPD